MEDVAEGTGDVAGDGALVGVKYVLRRSNGYFVDASYGFERFEVFSFRVGAGSVVDGFERGVRGMRVGGRRRFVVPPALGYVRGTGKGAPGPIPPDWGARRSLEAHRSEPLVFEVQLVKVKL